MDTQAVALSTALAVVVGHSAHASQYHLLVDSALGIGAGLLAVVGYVLLLRWRGDRDEEGTDARTGRQQSGGRSGQ